VCRGGGLRNNNNLPIIYQHRANIPSSFNSPQLLNYSGLGLDDLPEEVLKKIYGYLYKEGVLYKERGCAAHLRLVVFVIRLLQNYIVP